MSAGHELEVYAVFARPLPAEEAQRLFGGLEGLALSLYPAEPGRVRAVRLVGEAAPGVVLPLLRARLASGDLRWLELGLRGYALMEGGREYRPWRRNAYLGRAALEALSLLEPGVRYHGPA